MAKILVLNNWAIHPARTGGHQAVLQLCAGLAKGHACTYAFPSEHNDVLVHQWLGPRFSHIELPAKVQKAGLARLRTPGFLHADKVTKFALRARSISALKTALQELISGHDVVIFSHPWAWPAASEVPELKGKLVIYDSHNVEAFVAGIVHAPHLKKLVNRRSVRRIEGTLCQRADIILACTEEDRDDYASLYGVDPAKIHTGFKGVACAEHSQALADEMLTPQRTALFVGSAWGPNNQAAQAIAQDLAPASSFDWIIAGSCSEHVSAPPANVRLLGFVDDLPALMHQAMVAVNPVTTGWGVNMKMMEYLAAGLPVVTTPFGARGITGPARQALEVCELWEFPKAVQRLLDAPDRRQEMSRIARQAALQQFDWGVLTSRLTDLITTHLAAMPEKASSPHAACADGTVDTTAQPALSVICPVFRLGARAIDFLAHLGALACAPVSLEIIMVDDGSGDGTFELLQAAIGELASRAAAGVSLRLFSQSNQGLSAARNNGLAQARGKYVMFLDDDDLLLVDQLPAVLAQAERTGAQMVNLPYTERADSDQLIDAPQPAGTAWSGATFFTQLVMEHSRFITPACAYVYLRTFLEEHSLRFKVGIVHEDCLFTPQAVTQAPIVAIFFQPVYVYIRRPGSITCTADKTKLLKRLQDLQTVIAELIHYRDAEGNSTLRHCKPAINRWAALLLNYQMTLSRTDDPAHASIVLRTAQRLLQSDPPFFNAPGPHRQWYRALFAQAQSARSAPRTAMVVSE